MVSQEALLIHETVFRDGLQKTDDGTPREVLVAVNLLDGGPECPEELPEVVVGENGPNEVQKKQPVRRVHEKENALSILLLDDASHGSAPAKGFRKQSKGNYR